MDLSLTTGICVTLPGEEPRDVALINSKAVYAAFILENGKTPTALDRWLESVEGQPRLNDESEWTDVCKNPYKTVRETKVQSLQYRIVNRILPCNSYLRQLRIKESEVCNFCDQTDSISHFLFSCPVVQVFWVVLCAWFSRAVDLNMQGVKPKEFVFGIRVKSKQSTLMNYIVLQTKYFVYRQKLFHQGDLRLLHFLQELKMKLKQERFILRQEGKETKFRKWEPILSALG